MARHFLQLPPFAKGDGGGFSCVRATNIKVMSVYERITVRKAAKLKGTRFFPILAPCPTGWRFSSELTVKLSRLAVETNVFPLYKVIDGERYILNRMPKGSPVREYLAPQGRFSHLSSGDIDTIQRNMDRNWDRLKEKADGFTLGKDRPVEEKHD